MPGYEGSHQDWLEGQASDQLEREEYERSRHAYDVNRLGDNIFINLRVAGLTLNEATLLAHAILAEVEIAQRGDEDG